MTVELKSALIETAGICAAERIYIRLKDVAERVGIHSPCNEFISQEVVDLFWKLACGGDRMGIIVIQIIAPPTFWGKGLNNTDAGHLINALISIKRTR